MHETIIINKKLKSLHCKINDILFTHNHVYKKKRRKTCTKYYIQQL